MHRSGLLQQLAAYAVRYPEEEEVITQFSTFVQTNPDCFQRSLSTGHITGSAWVVNSRNQVLLTHHKKLGKWLQLGGHADGDSNALQVALREAQEESGFSEIRPVSESIFDIDIHQIPARGVEAEHLHFDVRYLFRAETCREFKVSDESHALAWVGMEEVETLTRERSLLRMVEKWELQKGGCAW